MRKTESHRIGSRSFFHKGKKRHRIAKGDTARA